MTDNKKFAERFNDIEMFRYCEQCGRCSSACLITGVNEFNIRRLVRHVELDLIEDIAGSTMPWFCAVCGRCEDACPNGIKIPRARCGPSDLKNVYRKSHSAQKPVRPESTFPVTCGTLPTINRMKPVN
jgi:Fe-S oxidoreductase